MMNLELEWYDKYLGVEELMEHAHAVGLCGKDFFGYLVKAPSVE